MAGDVALSHAGIFKIISRCGYVHRHTLGAQVRDCAISFSPRAPSWRVPIREPAHADRRRGTADGHLLKFAANPLTLHADRRIG
ncbi:hypothetical protein [Streptomyces sp. PTY087I2]|uniref:hypothetical protein n=1 Tax=Streptomyces sp. PTY087I2 TaxID=1819298 RepID=UPI00114CE626|nr:hypothetical protein [Streptomyces sp. PTY087I2]